MALVLLFEQEALRFCFGPELTTRVARPWSQEKVQSQRPIPWWCLEKGHS